MQQVTDFTPSVQMLLLRMMVTDSDLYTRVSGIVNVDNFDKPAKAVAIFMHEYCQAHKAMPTSDQIEAITGTQCQPLPEMIGDTAADHTKWFLDTFEAFTKRKELERAITEAFNLIEKGEFDPVEKMIKDAVQISLQRDLGLDYFADPRARLMNIKGSNGQFTTGWPSLDAALYGGLNRGELNIFAGCSGAGKSLVMQNVCMNWVERGMNGIYFSLELSEELCCMRIDSMVSGVSTKNIFKELDTVELRVRQMERHSGGGIRVKYLPAQSTVNHIRSYCKEYKIQTKKKIDFICVDYLDIMMPVSVKVNPSDQFIKDKYVSEELRNLAKELGVLFLTASQLNRGAVEETEFDHSDIAGGISKINTCDNLFGIFTSRAMRERGQYQLQLLKTRSSSGVGSKVDLEFNVDTLRITDPQPATNAPPNPPAYSPTARVAVQRAPIPVSAEDEFVNNSMPIKATGSVTSNRLKSLLNNIKTGK